MMMSRVVWRENGVVKCRTSWFSIQTAQRLLSKVPPIGITSDSGPVEIPLCANELLLAWSAYRIGLPFSPAGWFWIPRHWTSEIEYSDPR